MQKVSLFDRLYPNSYKPYLLQRLDVFLALAIFLLSLGVYFRTFNPSVTAGDSGELITTVYNMGASHPPGFPLYGIIGKLFTFLRFPDIGYKMNIFSGVSAAVAVLFAYLSMVKLLGFNRNITSFSFSVHIPAIAASLVFAFSKAHWSQAIMAEVYALNAALSSVLFFIMILWYEEVMSYREEQNQFWLAPRLTLLLAFMMGLSITNHQIPVWYIIAWALMLFPILYLILTFKNKELFEQLEARKIPLILFLVMGGIALVLLVISAIKPYMLFPNLIPGEYRLIFPQHVPFVLTAILCVPIWLTFATCQNTLYKYEKLSKISQQNAQILHVIFWVALIAMVGYALMLLGGAGIFIVAPLLAMSIYQVTNKKDLFKNSTENWVDHFMIILTGAMWLLVFAISIYLYMWIRAKAIAPLVEPKPLSWGDTQTIDILVNHMLRKQYPVGSDDYSNILGQLWALVQYHVGQFGWVNVILGLFGVYYFVKRDTVQATYFLLASFIYFWSIIDFINFEVNPRSLETQEVFFIQQFLVYVFFISFAYQWIFDIADGSFKFKQKKEGE
ncbi:MAG: glycosyltransferase family 117 protein [Brevinema sp.]